MAKVHHDVVSTLEQGTVPGEVALEVHARAGIPLKRSADLVALAQEVASRRQGQKVEFSDSWAEKIAADLEQFND